MNYNSLNCLINLNAYVKKLLTNSLFIPTVYFKY